MKNLVSLLLVLYTCSLHAQSIMGIEPAIKYGKIYRHTVNFKPAIERSSYSFDLNLTWQTTGNKEWQRFHYYPFLGVAGGYTEFGNKNVLGSAFFLTPNINLPLATTKKVQLYFRIAVGLAYLTKHYDALTNPTNDVIAASINNCSSFSLRCRFKASDRVRIFAGGSFTHFSTGDVKLPNLGINIPTFDVGINYSFKPVDETAFNHDKVITPNRHLLLGVKLGLGFNELAVPDGPVYPLYIGALQAGKFAGHWNKFSVGAQVDFNSSNYYFIVNQEISVGKQKSNSTDYSIYLQDEMQFGNFSLTLQVADYLKRTILSGTPLYEKLGTHYYFLHFGKDKRRGLSWGVCLTTHFFNADYVSTEIGLVL